MLKLYGIPNCNTVKKARDWLEKNSIAYEFQDFKKIDLTSDLLESWLNQIPREQLINRAGLTWRRLESSVKDNIVDNASAIALMREKTSVIKRPILVKDSKILSLGFDEVTYKKLIK